jgi:3-oxoacyl-[acyl-carrier protein] reductase
MTRVVIVTGASGGLGSAIAVQFALAGARVLVNYFSNKSDADDVVSKIRKSGGDAVAYQADVCDFEQVKAMVNFAAKKWGSVDVLVNSAGNDAKFLGGDDQLIVEMDEAMWHKVLNINLTGTFHCIKAVAPQMIKQKSGHIINVSSGTGLRGKTGSAPYAAAKAGVFGLTKTAALELGEHNVKVNTVCPARTRHQRRLREGHTAKPSNNILGRVSGNPEEFANFIVHLSTMEDVSGQTFNVDSRIVF